MLTSTQLRTSYLDFFKQQGHQIKPSTPIVPQGDATLMFNSAGMVPFKPYFLGLKTDLKRATSSQKCFRTTDVERVGTTIRHLTYFEMLGNFSFGDYFKAEAISWAWEFLTVEAGLDPKRLYPTVYEEDNEAIDLWKKVGCPNPAVKLGAETNFWNMGPTGPCGPCSEIYYDLGPQFATGKDDVVGGDGDRYIEIWNLVFTGFDRQADASLKPLSRPCIDTGMGLERLAFVAQSKASPFHTDLFWPIIEKAATKLTSDPEDPRSRLAYRVIADHTRAATMLASEGIVPSNVERGYVLRRLIRRAARYGQLMGCKKPFLAELVPTVLEIYKSAYPELKSALPQAISILEAEETKFLETLYSGEAELKKILDKSGQTLSGEQAFRLYETFGFPLELVKEILSPRGIKIDEEGFKNAQSKASETARASWRGSGEKLFSVSQGTPETQFLGYDTLESKSVVISIQGNTLILDQTPFYAEGGGQVGDTGDLISSDGSKVIGRVIDTQKQNGVIIHILDSTSLHLNALHVGTTLISRVDSERRAKIMPHHTATHLLNEALKRVLGAHIRQAGSYVGPDKLRFDFTHPKALTAQEIDTVEQIVKSEIKAAHPVLPRCSPLSQVSQWKATTLLGEDYGANPRFLLIGSSGWQDPLNRFSLELCGGTHVKNTSEILDFKIIREASASAGVRRIEALAGKTIEEYVAAQQRTEANFVIELQKKQSQLLSSIEQLGGKSQALTSTSSTALKNHLKELESHLENLKVNRLRLEAQSGKKYVQAANLKICVQKIDGADPKSLRALSDQMKTELGSGLVFLATLGQGKWSFVLAVTTDLTTQGIDAAKIAKSFAQAFGGSAGGRPDFAQGGVSNLSWDEAISHLTKVIDKDRT